MAASPAAGRAGGTASKATLDGGQLALELPPDPGP
jgi:hypothetical protein